MSLSRIGGLWLIHINLAHRPAEVKDCIMSRMRRTREERRLEIADAALRIVGEYGVQGATMSPHRGGHRHLRHPLCTSTSAGRTDISKPPMDLLQKRVTSWLDSSASPDALERLRQLGTQAHLHDRGRLRGGRRAFVRVRRRPHPGPDLKEQMGRRQREDAAEVHQTSSRMVSDRASVRDVYRHARRGMESDGPHLDGERGHAGRE